MSSSDNGAWAAAGSSGGCWGARTGALALGSSRSLQPQPSICPEAAKGPSSTKPLKGEQRAAARWGIMVLEDFFLNVL